MKRKVTEETLSEEFSGSDSESASDEDVEASEEKMEGGDGNSSTNEPAAKRSKADLYKAPTREEIAQLKEVEHLQDTRLFRLQINALLSEILVKEKKKKAVEAYVQQLTNVLLKLPSDINTELTDQKWVKKAKLQVPFTQTPFKVKGKFMFMPPKSVTSIGSFVVGTAIKPQPHIDLALEIPKASIQAKDHLNQRYLRKRALYLVAVAKHLSKCPLVDSMSFTYHHGNQLKPLLVIKPQGNLGKSISVRLHTCVEEGAFKPSRFHPARNNIRAAWYNGSGVEEEGDEAAAQSATPHYNQSLLRDMYLLQSHGTVARGLARATLVGQDKTQNGVAEGLAVLKLWLRLRQLSVGHGCFSGHILSMYVLNLVREKKLSDKMGSYQIIRHTLSELASSDWLTNPPSLAPRNPAEDLPSIADFQESFEVVFVDQSGWLNLCADMTADAYRTVRHEAQVSLSLVENASIDSFNKLLQHPQHFFEKYDQVLSIHRLSELMGCVNKLGCEGELMDRGGDYIATLLPHFLRLIRQGAARRIIAMSARPLPASTAQWSVREEPPSPLSEPCLSIGFVCNPDTCQSIIDKGPAADSPEAAAFREFWGERSELRRFADASMVEAVVWRGDTMAAKRSILSRVVRYILHRHTGLARNSLQSIVSQLDPLLQPHMERGDKQTPYGTGDERQARVLGAFDELCKVVRKLKGLPLTVTAVQGLSPVFKHTEVFPTVFDEESSSDPEWRQSYEVLLVLEGSGKWPEDVEAVQYVKAAFRLQLAKELPKMLDDATPILKTAVYETHIDVFHIKTGCVFRVDVGYLHEVQLHKMVTTAEGMVRVLETDAATALEKRIIALPKLTSNLLGLAQQHSSFGPATRLAKRWLRSQLLCARYIPDEAVELLMAAVYVHPAPYIVPGSPLTGFLRFLRLLGSHDWKSLPLIVNFNNKLSKEEFGTIEEQFGRTRSTLPWMFIATPEDKHKSQWTRRRPSAPILSRAILLAREAARQLEAKLDNPMSVALDFKAVFRPPLESYDVLLHLSAEHLPRTCQAVDAVESEGDVVSHLLSTKHMPAVDGDPVQMYLDELRETFEDYALFFHDPYGGQYIAIVWKPSTKEAMDFKITHMVASKPDLSSTSSSAKPKLSFQADVVIEDIRMMGKGLVKSISKPEKSS